MNKLGQYNDDERGHYNFSFSDSDGKHVQVSFRAEPDYDLDIVFSEFKNFLIASGHDVENDIGEIHAYDESHEDDDEPAVLARWTEDYENEKMEKQYQADKFSMNHLPNNGWPFGGLTSASIPSLTTADIASLKPVDWSSINQFPTMGALTSDQIKSWSLPAQGTQSWTFDSPGTLGGAKVQYK